MEFITSYDICNFLKEEPSKENIEKYIKLVGGTVDSVELNNFMEKIADKTYEDILERGNTIITLQNATKGSGNGAENKDDNKNNEAEGKDEEEDEDNSEAFDFDF